MRFPRTVIALAFSGVLVTLDASAGTDRWQFGFTPYLWLPSVDARLGFELPGSGGSEAEATNLLEHLEAALFLNAAATKGDWGLSVDLVYCDFSKSNSQLTSIAGAETTTGLTGSMVSLLGSHALKRSSNLNFDLLAGVRYTHIAATLDWTFAPGPGYAGSSGSSGITTDLWDGVVGIRGRFGPAGSAWFVPVYLDAGTGTSKFTWQGMVGVGYAFGWGDLLAVYRQLAFEEDATVGVQHLSFSGPALGATFRF